MKKVNIIKKIVIGAFLLMPVVGNAQNIGGDSSMVNPNISKLSTNPGLTVPGNSSDRTHTYHGSNSADIHLQNQINSLNQSINTLSNNLNILSNNLNGINSDLNQKIVEVRHKVENVSKNCPAQNSGGFGWGGGERLPEGKPGQYYYGVQSNPSGSGEGNVPNMWREYQCLDGNWVVIRTMSN